jgi:hypothetical protein
MKNTNGNLPAMPFIEESKSEQYNGATHTTATCMATGLTKREMFAMAAMQGILSNSSNSMSYCARDAVMMADELLAQLESDK